MAVATIAAPAIDVALAGFALIASYAASINSMLMFAPSPLGEGNAVRAEGSVG
jgi:hypothetical protein